MAHLEYRNGIEVIATARNEIADLVAPLLDPDQLEDVRVLASELVSNGVRHGRGRIEVTISCDHDHVVVAVSDRGEGEAKIRPHADGTGGFGLRLVEHLSERWEQTDADDGTTVRFWMRRPSV